MKTHYSISNWGPDWLVDFLFTDPTLTGSETVSKCQSVLKYEPASVCVKPCYVRETVSKLRDEDTQIGSMIGSPDGSSTTQIKVTEAKRSLTEGASFLIIPINVGYIRESRFEALINDIQSVSGLGHMNLAKVEVMFNLEWLGIDEILSAAKIVQKAGVDIFSFSIYRTARNWDLDLINRLKNALEKTVQLKGYAQSLNFSDLFFLFDSGFSRLGIVNYDPSMDQF
jgi:deoxyribose-phosphate aldolase